jgi:hypothetical protein
MTHGTTTPVQIDGRAKQLICKRSDSRLGIYPAYFTYPDMWDNIFWIDPIRDTLKGEN